MAREILGDTMTDFHHNIFYYYRGAQRSDQDREQQRDPQLEDNTTKALINTLEHCSPTVVLEFLDWLGITETGQVRFELQKATLGEGKIRSKSQRLLLGLVPSKGDEDPCSKLEESVKEPATGDSRPDAWLYGDGFVVLIESKVKGPLEPNQMQQHYQKLQVGAGRKPRCEVRTWAKMHQFFATRVLVLPELSDKDKWIVQQFTQYLEWNNMAEFTGLEEGIFDFFVTHDDEDTRRWVRDTMQSFAKRILDGLQAFDDSFYQNYDVGMLHLKDDHCWAAFGPGGKEYRQWAHQTVSLDAYGVDVFVNVELKHATNILLKERVRQDKQKFREIILGLPGQFSIHVEERKKKQAAVYDYHSIASLESYSLKHPESELGQYGFDYIETLLERVCLPYLTVRRRIDRNQALELSQKDQGRALVDEVIRIMRAFHPLVEFINEPDYTRRKKP